MAPMLPVRLDSITGSGDFFMVLRAGRSTEGDEKSYSTWCPLGILTSGESLSPGPFPFSDSSLCGTFHLFLQVHSAHLRLRLTQYGTSFP